tara:strand:- start:600 stop:1022 length:423 start_codon:yes stop_codon:yes gene_type:complete
MEIRDIASFAQGLLEETVTEVKETGVRPPEPMAAHSPDAPDISSVEISEDFQRKVLEESFKLKPASSPARMNEEEAYKRSLTEAYEQKLFELEELVAEMTSVGMISGGSSCGTEQPADEKPKLIRRKKKGSNARTRRSNY